MNKYDKYIVTIEIKFSGRLGFLWWEGKKYAMASKKSMSKLHADIRKFVDTKLKGEKDKFFEYVYANTPSLQGQETKCST